MDIYKQVRNWIDDLPKIGQTTFSVGEAERMFPEKTPSSVRRAIARLTSAGKIQSVWKGFYAVVLPEYGRSGVVPPIDYIDQLMSYLGKNYYVALLTAATYSGATHHAVRLFQIISDSVLHEKSKNGVVIDPAYKKTIPGKYLVERNSRTASVMFSSPELTAVDLLLYPKKAGGINFIVTILSELAESLNFGIAEPDFFETIPGTTVQRLGYLLDTIIGENAVADELYRQAMNANIDFRYTAIVTTDRHPIRNAARNERWKIIENYRPEGDL